MNLDQAVRVKVRKQAGVESGDIDMLLRQPLEQALPLLATRLEEQLADYRITPFNADLNGGARDFECGVDQLVEALRYDLFHDRKGLHDEQAPDLRDSCYYALFQIGATKLAEKIPEVLSIRTTIQAIACAEYVRDLSAQIEEGNSILAKSSTLAAEQRSRLRDLSKKIAKNLGEQHDSLRDALAKISLKTPYVGGEIFEELEVQAQAAKNLFLEASFETNSNFPIRDRVALLSLPTEAGVVIDRVAVVFNQAEDELSNGDKEFAYRLFAAVRSYLTAYGMSRDLAKQAESEQVAEFLDRHYSGGFSKSLANAMWTRIATIQKKRDREEFEARRSRILAEEKETEDPLYYADDVEDLLDSDLIEHASENERRVLEIARDRLYLRALESHCQLAKQDLEALLHRKTNAVLRFVTEEDHFHPLEQLLEDLADYEPHASLAKHLKAAIEEGEKIVEQIRLLVLEHVRDCLADQRVVFDLTQAEGITPEQTLKSTESIRRIVQAYVMPFAEVSFSCRKEIDGFLTYINVEQFKAAESLLLRGLTTGSSDDLLKALDLIPDDLQVHEWGILGSARDTLDLFAYAELATRVGHLREVAASIGSDI